MGCDIGSTKCSIFLIGHPILKQKLDRRCFPLPIGPLFCLSDCVISALMSVISSAFHRSYEALTKKLWEIHANGLWKILLVPSDELLSHGFMEI